MLPASFTRLKQLYTRLFIFMSETFEGIVLIFDHLNLSALMFK